MILSPGIFSENGNQFFRKGPSEKIIVAPDSPLVIDQGQHRDRPSPGTSTDPLLLAGHGCSAPREKISRWKIAPPIGDNVNPYAIMRLPFVGGSPAKLRFASSLPGVNSKRPGQNQPQLENPRRPTATKTFITQLRRFECRK